MCGLSLLAASRGNSLVAGHGLLTVVASVVEHGLQEHRFSSRGSPAPEQGLGGGGSGASSLRIMWTLPQPGIKSVSPALAGGFLSPVPPGKSYVCLFELLFSQVMCPVVGLLCNMVVLFLVFNGSSILFFMGFYQFTFPPTV